MRSALIRLLKEAQYWSPLRRYFFYRYRYLFTPGQLAFLCSCLEDTKDLPGTILEVGCASGNTTVFLNKHLEALGVEKPYVAIDTFEGFTQDDVEVEVRVRGKEASSYGGFSVNHQRWFDYTMKSNGVHRVRSVKADAVRFDYRSLGRVSFSLIDVDLYRPVRAALEGIFDLVPTNGMVVVDDCAPGTIYDGALQAYEEFVGTRGLPTRIVHGKLGVIVKP